MALGEVGVSLPWCHALVLLAPGYWRFFLNLINDQFQRNFRSKLKLWNFKFQLWPKIPLKLVIFSLCKNYEIKKKSSVTWSQKDKGVASSWEWHAYFSYIGPFYYIQTNFLYFFAHDCNRLLIFYCCSLFCFRLIYSSHQLSKNMTIDFPRI